MHTSLPHLSLTLASKSPARLATLRAAGVNPAVAVSHVDEDELLTHVVGGASGKVLALAMAKARAVADQLRAQGQVTDLVLGCDSMFEFGGEVVGKPHSPEVARERLRAMSGKAGWLHTGHALLQGASGVSLGAVSQAKVHVAKLSDATIDAYIATGEPLHVAGSFTVDGLGGPFIEHVDGDYHGVVGLSLPLVRAMLESLDLSFTQLWGDHSATSGELSKKARTYLSRSKVWVPEHSADGFIYCSCGRQHWGLAGAAGVFLIREREGVREALVQLRSPLTHGGKTWSIPGGARAWNETPEQGGWREFAEETSIDQPRARTLGQHVDDHGTWAYTSVVAELDSYEADVLVTTNPESDALTWVPLAALEAYAGSAAHEGAALLSGYPLHPGFASALPHLLKCARQGR